MSDLNVVPMPLNVDIQKTGDHLVDLMSWCTEHDITVIVDFEPKGEYHTMSLCAQVEAHGSAGIEFECFHSDGSQSIQLAAEGLIELIQEIKQELDNVPPPIRSVNFN